MRESLFTVVTTIQQATPAIQRLKKALDTAGGKLIIVGDSKGPASFPMEGVIFSSLADQKKLPFRLSRLLPIGHYARKNLGYLMAIQSGASCIYDTDDDNAPMNGWSARSVIVHVRRAKGAQWVNAYRFFTEEKIWPRGFPLRLVRDDGSLGVEAGGEISIVVAPIQQGLVDLSPDVDAVWRLVLDQEFRFRKVNSILLPQGSWCPFNSQSTWWHPPAWPLLYLPSRCSFRMTDIWRSFIAQRCLWELGAGVVFHSSEVEQERNVHDLMADFRDEVPGYLRNEELVRILETIRLEPGKDAVGANMVHCYEAMQEADFFSGDELRLVKAWLVDVDDIVSSASLLQEPPAPQQ
jgi:hypothetical protein